MGVRRLNRVTIDIFVCVLAIVGTKAMVRTMKTSQELRMLSTSLSDFKSLLLNVMIQVLQFVSNSRLCHIVTNSLDRSQSKSKSLSL